MKYILGVLLYCFVSAAGAAMFELGSDSRTSLALTVFNSNLAVVRDTRQVTLPNGEIELEFTDVAQTIFPATVQLSSSAQQGFAAEQQKYRYDLLNRASLLERFVGRKVKYSRFLLQEQGYEKVLREGILLSVNPEIVKFGDIIEVSPEGTISLPYIPDDLKTIPTLVFRGNNERSGNQDLTVRYHAGGISWKADYALTLDKRASLDGWVTIVNQSNTDFSVDELSLVAGDLNVDRAVPLQAMSMVREAVADMQVHPQASTAGDYHRYDFPGLVDLQKNDLTQLKLLGASGVRYEKSYRLRSQVQQYRNQPVEEKSPSVWIEFENIAGNNLGAPLPAGSVRVYEIDGRTETFSGEARIGHTPKGAQLELEIGRAFDVKAKRTQIGFRRLGDRSAQLSYRIEVFNHADEDITVLVEEGISGDWRVIDQSLEGEKRDAATYVFELAAAAEQAASVEYTLEINW